MTTWWCEHAVIAGVVQSGVTISAADGRITDVGIDTAPAPGSTRLPGLTVAGFANAHSHAFHRALRSRTQVDRGTFWTWRKIMYGAAERLDPDSYFRLARAVFAEMALTGIAAVGEFHYLHHQPDGRRYDDENAMGHALIAAAAAAGIRITLLDTLYLHAGMNDSGYDEASGVQRRFTDGDGQAWAERLEALDRPRTADGFRVGAAIHSVRAVDAAGIEVAVDWAAGRGAPLHVHVSEQPDENAQCRHLHGCTPTELLAQSDALDGRLVAVHATHLSDDDVSLLGRSGAGVCVCPTTERDLGDGIGPTAELTSAGATLSLGSDSHAVIDHLVEARAVEMNQRLRSLERGVHTAAELLDMACVHGHGALGWHDAGALEVGHRADLTTVALDSERTAGASAALAIETAVFAATASDITSVIIDGKTVVCNGRHEHIDVAGELSSTIAELFA